MREILVYDDYEIHKLGSSGGTQYEEVTTEKATRIDVTDVAKTKGKLLPFGRTTQKQLSGKNLFDINAARHERGNVQSNISDDTLNFEAVGTLGAQYVEYVVQNLDPTKNYILSCKGKKIVQGTDGKPWLKVAVRGSNDDTTYSGELAVRTISNPLPNTEYTLVTSQVISGYSFYKVFIYNNAGTPVTIGEKTQYYDIQFEEGDTATDYEPYCEGQASPNPDYPQPIENVEGRSCKNLFDGEWTGKISTNFIYVYAGRNYKYSEQGEASAMNFRFYENTESSEYITTNVSASNYYTPEANGYVKLYKTNTSFIDCQLEEGTVVTPYEPYFEGKRLELNVCNKQLFNKNDYLFYRGYIVSSSNTTIHYESNNYMVYIPCKTNTNYTISKIITKRFAVGYTTEIPTDGVILQNVTMKNDSDTSISIQTGNDAQYLVAYIRNGNIAGESSLENIINSLQIEQGSTATSYEEHKEQMIPFPLQDGQKLMEGDYLADDGVHHVRGKIVFDGTEYWNKDVSQDNLIDYFYRDSTFEEVNRSNIDSVLCNYFKKGTLASQGFWATSVFGITINKTFTGIVAEDSKTERINKFKNWLSNHNVILEYDLEQETIDPYTPAQAEAYNKLMNLLLYKGVNHIWTNTDGLEPNLQLTYKRVKQEGVLQVSNVQPLNNLELNNTEETPEEITTEISEE